jgi:hypothetical protein
MKGGYQNREKSMDDEELKEAYIKIMVKYKLEGIAITEPSKLNFFNPNNHEKKQSKKRKTTHAATIG